MTIVIRGTTSSVLIYRVDLVFSLLIFGSQSQCLYCFLKITRIIMTWSCQGLGLHNQTTKQHGSGSDKDENTTSPQESKPTASGILTHLTGENLLCSMKLSKCKDAGTLQGSFCFLHQFPSSSHKGFTGSCFRAQDGPPSKQPPPPGGKGRCSLGAQ